MASEEDRVPQDASALPRLFDEMALWGKRYDPDGARRRVEAVDPAADLMLVAEAYAATTVRITGVNWFDAYGRLGNAGTALERLLRCVGRTLSPPRSVVVQHGTIAGADAGTQSVYTTDIFPCYPLGREHPSKAQVADAIARGFLDREIDIVRPKVIVLLGGHAYEGFHRHLLGRRPDVPLTAMFGMLSATTSHPEYRGAVVLPWLHTSGASPAYSSWFSAVRADLCRQPQIRALAHALERRGA